MSVFSPCKYMYNYLNEDFFYVRERSKPIVNYCL